MISFLFYLNLAWSVPIVNQQDVQLAQSYINRVNELTPYGRLQVAIEALEDKAEPSVIIALGNSHPHIAAMLVSPTDLLVLNYLLSIPSTERHKIRKGDGIIRKIEQMSKPEKKKAVSLAKEFGVKKVEGIRLGSFDGIHITVEISYKFQGSMTRKTILMAPPYAPEIAQKSRTTIESKLGTRPLPPTKGPYSLMPFANPSFENKLVEWSEGVAFRFENDEPLGIITLDKDQKMDGTSSLKFYNTEETMIFPKLSQTIPVGNAYKIRLQAFVQSKNARIEYRQVKEYTRIHLEYTSGSSQTIKEEQALIRLGSYDWEPMTIDSFVPQDATNLSITVSSSVSGTIWVDGVSIIRLD